MTAATRSLQAATSMTCQVGQDRDVTFTYTATDNDTGVSEPKTITITVTGSNDAPVAKDATETTEENTVLNGNVPAATDVDGTVESYQLVDDAGPKAA
ncbi:Ig-like domain-containing protein [Vibrio lentus]|nr:Ig-like domain-containing protein [Vibrio lentus]